MRGLCPRVGVCRVGEVLRLADLPSVGVDPRLRAAARLDPFWDGLWASGSQASWLNVTLARRQEAAGLGRLPASLAMDSEEAWDRFLGLPGWRRKLELVGLLYAWRTMTAEQLAAFMACPSVASRGALIDSGFAAGLFDVGVFVNGLVTTQGNNRARLVRLARSKVFVERLEPLLTFPERLFVTGGRPFTTGRQHDRHNLLMAELALRVAELCEVETVLGEAYATSDLLLGEGLGRESLVMQTRAADGVLVRPDGLRVVVEMTASITPTFEEKVSRWAQMMHESPLAASGLTVLFVGAPPPDRGYSTAEFRVEMQKKVKRVLRRFPGVPGLRVADRMSVAMWSDWFPGAGLVDESFFTLGAFRTEGLKDSGWDPVGVLDVFDTPFEADDPGWMSAVVDNSALVASAPTWLRVGKNPPPVHRLALLEELVDEVPVPFPKDARAARSYGSGSFQGPGGRARVPERLLPVPGVSAGAARAS